MGGFSTMTESPEEIPRELGSTRRRGSGLWSNMLGLEMGGPVGGGGDQSLTTDRMTDDATGRSGGPNVDRPSATTGGAGTGQGQDYGAGARAHLADLIKQRDQTMQAVPPVPLKKRILQALPEIAGVAGAAFSGIPGATTGAAQGIQTGVNRRNQVTDIHDRERYERQNKLIDEVNQQRTLMDREDMENKRLEQQGDIETKRMTLQEKMRQEHEDAMMKQIAARGDESRKTEGVRQTGREELEDQKQTGRMALARANNDARAAMARVRAAAAANKAKAIPPLVGKSFDDFENSQTRFDLMTNSYQKAMADPGNQQAQLLLLTNHIGMTLGAQKGARITQAILDEAKASGYLDERIEAHFGPDGVMTGVVLTPRQMTQMMDLAKDKLLADSNKVQQMEMYFNAQGGQRATPRFTPPANAPSGGPPPPKPGFKTQQRTKPDGTIEYRQVPIAPAK